jgi:hypothetical protein
MSSTTMTVSGHDDVTERSVRTTSLVIGAITAAGAAALAYYAAYGEPHPKANQESGVPSLIVIGVLAAAVVFGFLVPRSLRNREGKSTGRIYGIAALVLTPLVFWSGVPIVLGAAGVFVGRAADTTNDKARTVAVVTGALAIGLTIAVTVLGNTVFAR